MRMLDCCDCCHGGAPGMEATLLSIPAIAKRRSERPLPGEYRDVYRDMNYARRETERLAEQLKRLE